MSERNVRIAEYERVATAMNVYEWALLSVKRARDKGVTAFIVYDCEGGDFMVNVFEEAMREVGWRVNVWRKPGYAPN